jgi:hypothetical protein
MAHPIKSTAANGSSRGSRLAARWNIASGRSFHLCPHRPTAPDGTEEPFWRLWFAWPCTSGTADDRRIFQTHGHRRSCRARSGPHLVPVWLIGLPSPLALSVIAGVAEFVPYLGPILAAIPALLVATTQGIGPLLWTGFAYILIHQAKGNLIAPLIQRHMIFIPPAVMLLGIVTVLFVFGIAAAALAVIIFVAIEKLYLRDSLGEKVSLPGEPK